MKWLTQLQARDSSRFIRYTLVGALWTVINIGTDVLLVDYVKLPGWAGTLISLVILYIGRYYSYLFLDVIKPEFLKYVSSTLIFTLCIWVVKIVALDVFSYSAMVASPSITLLAFILKFFFYRSIGLLQSDKEDTI